MEFRVRCYVYIDIGFGPLRGFWATRLRLRARGDVAYVILPVIYVATNYSVEILSLTFVEWSRNKK